VAAAFVPLLVNLFSLKRLLWLMTPSARFRPYKGASPREIAKIVRRRLRNPTNMRRRRCLREGLMMFHFLCLAGKAAVLRIGAYAPSEGLKRMHAHCWVTLDGDCISSPPHEPVAVVLTHTQPRGGAA